MRRVGLSAICCLWLSALGVVFLGCGSAVERSVQRREVSTADLQLVRDADGDQDNTQHGHYDLDDYSLLHFGHAATGAESMSIGAVVKSYYAAGAKGDGEKACSLLFLPLAEAVPEEYAESQTEAREYGRTCGAVMSRVFHLHRQEWLRRASSLAVTGIRVENGNGYALVRFVGLSDQHLHMRREGNRWTVRELFDEGLP